MTDMRTVIIPKSDQLNADDLISGPRTVTITSVSVRPGTEQPVAISFAGDDGKPYKPCKSMCRVMVAMWGADAKEYAGRSMTLYRDPKVKWAGLEVGGIRISHMSHINRDHVMALTESKQSRKPFTVRPLSLTVQPPQHDPLPPAPPHDPAEPAPVDTAAAGQALFDGEVKAAMQREWTKEAIKKRGAEIAAALRDNDGFPDNLEASWALVADEIMTMPAGAQKGLRAVYDAEFKKIEAAA